MKLEKLLKKMRDKKRKGKEELNLISRPNDTKWTGNDSESPNSFGNLGGFGT